MEAAREALDSRLGTAYQIHLLRSECDFRRGELCGIAVFHIPGPDGLSKLHPQTVKNACDMFVIDYGLGRLEVIKNRYGKPGPCLQDSIPWLDGLKFSLVRPVK